MKLQEGLATGSDVRRRARSGEWAAPTAGLAPGYVQANLVIVPRVLAYDFLLFCQRNPRPCPLLEVTEVGSYEPKLLAPGADLRKDLPRYCVYRSGQLVDQPTDITCYWTSDLVSFLIGCSFTFEESLMKAGVPIRHIEQGRNVPMYRTNISCQPAGIFRGPMTVSMRPMTPGQAVRATQICSRFPRVHGAPVQIGLPETLGIQDLSRPDYGEAVEVRAGEVPVFWACGVTPQSVALAAKPDLIITHNPGHMFVTDWLDSQLEG